MKGSRTGLALLRCLRFSLISLMSMPALSQSPPPPPKQEVRAVWIATVNGLDWPRSSDAREQQRSLLEIVERLHAARFNSIFFQVRGRGDALYRSSHEPWSEVLTGTLGGDPGWDPLQFLLDEAHARAMEVHAWFNTYFVRSGKEEVPMSTPRHVALAHPDWVRTVEGQIWLDPGLPAVRNYLLSVAMDLVRKYDIDGVQFDFARYPGPEFPDERTYRNYGGGMPRDEWRRENISKFMRALYDSATALKPALKIGSAPIGIYANTGAIKGLQGFSDLYQDARAWLRERSQDYVVPQVYWSLGDRPANPDFGAVAKDWTEHSFGRQVVIGIGAYKPEVRGELPALIDVSRSLGAAGSSFFRYGNMADSLGVGGRYRFPANIPPMPWKNGRAPDPPANPVVENVHDDIFRLRWDPPPREGKGGAAAYYDVYRSSRRPVDVHDPAHLLAVLPARTTVYADTIAEPRSPAYYYAVSALDRYNVEGAPAPAGGAVIPEIAGLAKPLERRFTLGSCYPDPASSVVFFRYEIPAPAPVFLKILNQSNEEVMSVVDAVQGPGSYIAAADVSSLRKGTYTYMLIAGNQKEKKQIVVDN